MVKTTRVPEEYGITTLMYKLSETLWSIKCLDACKILKDVFKKNQNHGYISPWIYLMAMWALLRSTKWSYNRCVSFFIIFQIILISHLLLLFLLPLLLDRGQKSMHSPEVPMQWGQVNSHKWWECLSHAFPLSYVQVCMYLKDTQRRALHVENAGTSFKSDSHHCGSGLWVPPCHVSRFHEFLGLKSSPSPWYRLSFFSRQELRFTPRINNAQSEVMPF